MGSQTLLELMFFVERFTLARAWTEPTEDEYPFEPVPGAWSIQLLAECRRRTRGRQASGVPTTTS